MTPSQDIIPSFQETDSSTAKIEAMVDVDEEDWTIDSHEEAAASDIVNKGVVSFATNAITTLFRGLGDVILTVGVNLVHSEDPFGAVALDYQRRRLSRSFENNFFMEGMWSRWEDDKVPALFNESCKLSYHFKLLESSQSSALVPDKTVSAIMSNEACDEEVGASSILQDLSQDTSADSKFEHHFIRNIDITDGGEVKFLSNELDAVDLASPGLTPTFSADDSDYEEILHDGQNDTTFLEEVLGTLEDNMDLDGFVLIYVGPTYTRQSMLLWPLLLFVSVSSQGSLKVAPGKERSTVTIGIIGTYSPWNKTPEVFATYDPYNTPGWQFYDDLIIVQAAQMLNANNSILPNTTVKIKHFNNCDPGSTTTLSPAYADLVNGLGMNVLNTLTGNGIDVAAVALVTYPFTLKSATNIASFLKKRDVRYIFIDSWDWTVAGLIYFTAFDQGIVGPNYKWMSQAFPNFDDQDTVFPNRSLFNETRDFIYIYGAPLINLNMTDFSPNWNALNGSMAANWPPLEEIPIANLNLAFNASLLPYWSPQAYMEAAYDCILTIASGIDLLLRENPSFTTEMLEKRQLQTALNIPLWQRSGFQGIGNMPLEYNDVGSANIAYYWISSNGFVDSQQNVMGQTYATSWPDGSISVDNNVTITWPSDGFVEWKTVTLITKSDSNGQTLFALGTIGPITLLLTQEAL
ncbi:hypothetical protein HDU79_011719 [Rhizoclosmatium sp. JEL0117]|nr:hypothetical protein HDU79_011719 [Rhizoclosmatium sp. JEL0117]